MDGFEENMNLVFKDDALPNMPISLRQRLKFKKVPEALVDPNVKKWEVARISKLLCEEKHNTLKMFTTEEQSRVNEYANYSQKSTTKFAKSEADMNNIPHEMSQAAFWTWFPSICYVDLDLSTFDMKTGLCCTKEDMKKLFETEN